MGAEGKPLNKWTNREWRGACIAFVAIGVLILIFGIREGNSGMIKTGATFIGIGVVLGALLHFVFGIKIIQIRKDFKYEKDLD